jgi:thiopeptide-type bacteriocin biosynthesis protein
MDSTIPPDTIEAAVLAVISGTPLDQAAARIAIDPPVLTQALQLYQAAGHAALATHARTGNWHELRIGFSDWDTAEHTAAVHLRPELQQASSAGTIASWWFMRKAPCWRLRYQPGPTSAPAKLETFISGLSAAPRHDQLTVTARHVLYEPELCAFGGADAITIAHRLFHADSHNILSYLTRPAPASRDSHIIGRRELSILLCSALLHGAGQDWYEQGDIWHRVTEHRPLPSGTPRQRLDALGPALRQLMSTDTGPESSLTDADGPLAFAAPWATAFDEAGAGLNGAARDGKLGRGLRAVLAHHILFHWNRLGLTARAQSILAAAAADVVLGS